MLIAGGTDLLPNMKRRQMAPKVLVSLAGIAELRNNGSALWRGPDAHANRQLESADRAAPGRAPGRHRAPAQHGHARRQPLPRHALQLLQPELRVAQGDRLLPEEGRRHLLGGDREQALRRRFIHRLRASADRARGAPQPRFDEKRKRSRGGGLLQQRRHRLPQAAAGRDPDRGTHPGHFAAVPTGSCAGAARSTSRCWASPRRPMPMEIRKSLWARSRHARFWWRKRASS